MGNNNLDLGALDLLKEKFFELDENQKWKDANKNFKKYYINN